MPPSLEELNTRLRAACQRDQERTMAGRAEAIHDLLAVDRAALLPLPERALEIGTLRAVVVRSTGRVRFETNEYSVPTRYAGQRLTLRADPFRVRVYAAGEVVADHPRCYGRHQVFSEN